MNQAQNNLLEWYHTQARDLPWRNTRNPYFIWLSEIILQQTRVEQGRPYYEHFIHTYPDVLTLAEAEEQDVLKSWEGLGYYSRARNLHAAAKYVVHELNGVFPTSYKELLKLKGVGTYTAAAIASFSSGEAVAVLDGNVFRVLSRFFDVSTPIDSTQGKKEFTQLSNEFLNNQDPANHNQAMMELGATVCTPTNPVCAFCPINNSCLSAFSDKWRELPVKAKKTKVKDWYLQFYVFEDNKGFILEKRQKGGVWKNLYQFPVQESFDGFDENHNNLDIISVSKIYEHLLSHRRIKAQFIKVRKLPLNKEVEIVKRGDLSNYPFPKLIINYLQDENII